MRDIETIDAELRLVAALRRAARERGGPLPSIDVADGLLDERNSGQLCRRALPARDDGSPWNKRGTVSAPVKVAMMTWVRVLCCRRKQTGRNKHRALIAPWVPDPEGAAMITLQGQPTRAAAKWAQAMANSVEANQRRRRREPPVIDWDEAIANLLDILDDIYDPDVVI
jgi:hypothetical protein